jgi:serine/threonine protein kinase
VSDVLDRLKSALADRYSIERELGSGGMATVYLADDLKHHRRVAVKVLRRELAAALGAERFLQEIQVTARLSHPHILPLHDSGEADGFLHYVMPYVAGESLRQRLERETQLPIDEALRIIQQVAAALDFAHRQNVIHRDIKPENILLHEGEAMVADFGIALAVSAAGGERLTETGVSVGTVEYMSPEQATGEGEPDARSDIYSLGCVLYEMLVGEPPYTGPTAMAVLAKRLSDPVPSARRLRSAVPVPVDAALVLALAKEPVDRFGSASEFVNALTAEAGAHVEAVKSIVVLPFANLSPDPEQEYFCDGLTEEVIADLSGIRALRVISRNSAMQLKGTTKDTRTIGRELGVQFVLEGSVRKAGDNLRITGQLIDASNDAHLWAGKYSGTLDDVFDIQENVSRSIVNALEITLSPDEKQKIEERPIDDAQAYDLHVRARHEIMSCTEDGFGRALQYIQRGLEIIGENEVLYGDMGHVYMQYIDLGFRRDETFYEKAEECAVKAFSLNPHSPHGHFLKGFLSWRRGRIQEGALEYKRALSIDPYHLDSLFRLAWLYGHSGKSFAARPLITRHLEIDPLTPASYIIAGAVELLAGHFDAALDPLKRAYETEPLNPFFRYWYAKGLAYSHRVEEACELLKLIGRETPETHWAGLGMFFAHALEGQQAEALKWVTEEFRSAMKGDEMLPIWMAESYSLLDEREEAIDWVEEGVRWGFINYPFLATHDAYLEGIRGDARFKKLLSRVKEEWEAFEV